MEEEKEKKKLEKRHPGDSEALINVATRSELSEKRSRCALALSSPSTANSHE